MISEAYPVLFYCSVSEMLYIVNHRLTAQNIDSSKSRKVLRDVIMAIFEPSNINKVLLTRKLMSLETLKAILMDLAHSSIMRINQESMDKLFDLIVMVVKYQLVFAQSPLEILDIVSNHLDSVYTMTTDTSLMALVDLAKRKFMDFFESNYIYRLQLIRTTLLAYLIGIKTKVSALIRMGVQDSEGNFLLNGENTVGCYCQIPGTINYLNGEQVIATTTFEAVAIYKECSNRTSLGFSIFINEVNDNECQESGNNQEYEEKSEDSKEESKSKLQEDVKKRAVLLANLIGKCELDLQEPKELLLILNEEEKEVEASNSPKEEIVAIGERVGLKKIMEEMSNETITDEKEEKENLLSLIDLS